MKRRTLFSALAISALLTAPSLAAPADAQLPTEPLQRFSVEPYVGYNFLGSQPGGDRIDAAVAFGGRLGYQFTPQWGAFGNVQRSSTALEGTGSGNVDHWSAGGEFSYVPRGAPTGMLPVLLEAGLGQARYDFDGEANRSDFGVNLGVASAFALTPNFAVRYGVNDYISNYRNGEGVTNQFTARAGVEISF